MKKCHIFTSKKYHFFTFRNCFILHGHVFVMCSTLSLVHLRVSDVEHLKGAISRINLSFALVSTALLKLTKLQYVFSCSKAVSLRVTDQD